LEIHWTEVVDHSSKRARFQGGLFLGWWFAVSCRVYFAGRTCISMKLSWVLIERISMIVPVFEWITLPRGFAGS
jgi:hypothetical protein